MKVYLDTCCLHRPLDDRSQLRIRLEAEAVLGILMAVETGHVQLMSSEVLVFEVRMNPHPQKRAFVSAIIESCSSETRINEQIETRAISLQNDGFKAYDALHLACAEAGSADYFCSCDDRLLKKAGTRSDLRMKTMSPMDLIKELAL
jgi:predicted nucleic acid-binding protein